MFVIHVKCPKMIYTAIYRMTTDILIFSILVFIIVTRKFKTVRFDIVVRIKKMRLECNRYHVKIFGVETNRQSELHDLLHLIKQEHSIFPQILENYIKFVKRYS